MKFPKVKAGFIRYRDSDLVIAGARIITSIKSSPAFSNPSPPIEVVENIYAEYKQAVIDASRGGRLDKVMKRKSKRLLADALQQWAHYVNVVSDGDLTTLYASGFPVLEKRNKGHAPFTPQHPFLKDGRVSGEVAYGFEPVGRDMLYQYQFATTLNGEGEPVWEREGITSRSFKAYEGGFAFGCTIYFRVRALNKHGFSDWSTIAQWKVR